MSPEVVDIPVVFMGAGLPEGETYRPLLSGTDIAPTVLSAQRNRHPDVDGTDVWRTAPRGDRKLRSDVWQHVDIERAGVSMELTVYAATSVWNRHGGYTFHRKSRLQRCAAIAFDNLFRGYAPAWKHNASLGDAISMAEIGLSRVLAFGAPDFSRKEAKESTPAVFSKGSSADGVTLSDDQQEQLRNLGYLQ